MSDEPVLVTDPRVPLDKLIFDGIDTTHAPNCSESGSRKSKSRSGVVAHRPKKCSPPTFTVSEVAKMFFGKSTHWVRLLEPFILDEEEVANRRTDQGARYYTLGDIELMAHALAQQRRIDAIKLNDALVMLHTSGRIWGYL